MPHIKKEEDSRERAPFPVYFATFLITMLSDYAIKCNSRPNRYLHIKPTAEWRVQPNLSENPTSTRQVPDKLHTDNIVKLVLLVGEHELSVKEMMSAIGLKDRENFMNLYLHPAVADGYIQPLYPQSPRHPYQKYLLTDRGLALYRNKME